MKRILTAAVAAIAITSPLRAQNNPSFFGSVIVNPYTDASNNLTQPSLSMNFYNGIDLEGTLNLRYLMEFDAFSNPVGQTWFQSDPMHSQWIWQGPSRLPNPQDDDGIAMRLDNSGSLELRGPDPDDTEGLRNILLNTSAGEITINGVRVLTETDLVATLLPQIQTVTLQASQALSVGGATVYGAGSMASGDSTTLVNGAGSLAFGNGARVGVFSNNLPFSGANNAIALGNNARAEANGAMAFGKGAKATKTQNIAIGEDSEASGDTAIWWGWGYDWGSVAVGTKAKAAGTASTAFGLWAQALGNESVAVGPRALVSSPALGGIAVGWGANSGGTDSIALGSGTRAWGTDAIALGPVALAYEHYAMVFGIYADATSTGQVVLGVAPQLPAGSTSWTDDDVQVLVVGAGKIGGADTLPNGLAVTRRTALSVTRGGNLTVGDAGTTGYNRFKAPILVPQSGDIDMGEFTLGEQP